MTGSFWLDLLIGAGTALLLAWLALIVALVLGRPRGALLPEALRLLPDVLRLIRRLAADPGLPRGVRIRLGAVLVYLALPIDLIPDFIPVLGYADDAIIVARHGFLSLHSCSISGIERSSVLDVACRRPMMAPHLAPSDASRHGRGSSRPRPSSSIALSCCVSAVWVMPNHNA